MFNDLLLPWAVRARTRLSEALHRNEELDQNGERGDVPGWVLITVMTAGLVITIWGIAETTLEDMFSEALSAVTKD
jgi:hypothetical protein